MITPKEEPEMKKIVLVAAILALAVCATAAWSQGGRPDGPRPGGPGMPSAVTAVMLPPAQMFDQMATDLGLTADQVTELKSIATKNAEVTAPLMKTAADSARALREALLASDYDSDSVARLATATQKAETAVITANINAWTQVRAAITADQIKLLQEMMSRPPAGPRPGPGPAPMR